MIKQAFTALALSAILLWGSGCVSQSHADGQEKKIESLLARNIELERELETKDSRILLLQDGQDKTTELTDIVLQRDRTISELRDALAAASRELANASFSTELPADLDRALASLAEENSDVLSYDSVTGLIKFKSDFTFNPGSDQVKAVAQASLAKLAAIMKLPSAAGYEIQIVGHTDNVKISKPATRRMHPTNRHLSAHRAIAVCRLLAKSGVANNRMLITGAGKHRPIVENTRKGASANRRVEIYLKPMKKRSVESHATTDTIVNERVQPTRPIRIK